MNSRKCFKMFLQSHKCGNVLLIVRKENFYFHDLFTNWFSMKFFNCISFSSPVSDISDNTVTKLTTFTGGHQSSKSSLVQMRRTTNRKGKQAPAPPKRTRYFLTLTPPTTILITQRVLTVKYIMIHICSLLSSCSSFRDSTFDDHGQNENMQEDIAEINGISKKFKGILLSLCISFFTY